MSSSRPARTLLAVTVAAVGLSPLAVVAPASAAVADGVVISEVYGGGGAATSVWNRDFVELHNPTGAPVSLDGASLQYRSAGGTANPTGVTALAGSIEPGGYYLVGLGGGTAGEPIPTPDASGSTQMSGAAGTVFLASQPTALAAPAPGSVADRPGVVDLVGYGSSNTFETAAAAQPTNATTLARDADGTDTDDNSADFEAGVGTPGAPPEGREPAPVPDPTDVEIAQIQGTGFVSPLVGQRVRTTGVVTAAYPTGGLAGFNLQTAGTGGRLARDHDASHGIFVRGAADQVEVGDHVQVTGFVEESFGLTRLVSPDLVALPTRARVRPARVEWPRTAVERERLEGMLLDPQGRFTISDNFSTNRFGEVGLASGVGALVQPTEVANPVTDPARVAAVEADNSAREIVLDDGATTDFLRAQDQPLPYLTQEPALRVGSEVRFREPVVLDFAFGRWRFQPTAQLLGTDRLPIRVRADRDRRPDRVGGDLSVASFNVLNYFTTTGADFVAAGGRCTYFTDRAGAPVTANRCTGPNGEPGPRGAADAANLERQERKLVAAIKGLDADVVGIEEIENSARFGKDRDEALRQLVAALNEGERRAPWAFVPTPRGQQTPESQADEDVIRTAFIYQRDAVAPVGESLIHDVAAFDDARDPLAQVFQPERGRAADRFAVIVNHFKSKGSGVPGDGDEGQGASNKSRTAAARSLVDFAETVKTAAPGPRVERVFLAGDFNAYSAEDPMQVMYDAGYTSIGTQEAAGEYSYLFGGRVGSLDHVLGNQAAMRTVRGGDIWGINAVESVALEYSRRNYNVTDLYRPDAYRSSDHDPLKVGITARAR